MICVERRLQEDSELHISEHIKSLKSDSHVFVKLKFSPAMFQKIPSYFRLVFKI